MENNFQELNFDVEQAIDFAFEGKFVLKFYDYLKIRKTKRDEINHLSIRNLSENNTNWSHKTRKHQASVIKIMISTILLTIYETLQPKISH